MNLQFQALSNLSTGTSLRFNLLAPIGYWDFRAASLPLNLGINWTVHGTVIRLLARGTELLSW